MRDKEGHNQRLQVFGFLGPCLYRSPLQVPSKLETTVLTRSMLWNEDPEAIFFPTQPSHHSGFCDSRRW